MGGRQQIRLLRTLLLRRRSSSSVVARLPNLKQGGTLTIRSSLPRLTSNSGRRLDVRIVPQWRDDAQLELRQASLARREETPESPGEALEAEANDDEEVGMRIDVTPTHPENGDGGGGPGSSGTAAAVGTLGKSSGRVSVLVDLKSALSAADAAEPPELVVADAADDAESTSDGGTEDEASPELGSVTLTAHVPEKLNVTCHLAGPGDIEIAGKMEGERGFDLHTSAGNIKATKLRGDTVRLFAGTGNDDDGASSSSGGGIVHVTDLIEAQTVDVTAEGRVRAKMINGTDVNILVPAAGDTENKENECKISKCSNDSSSGPFEPLEVDDALALIDVGSLYTSRQGDGATLTVSEPCGGSTTERRRHQRSIRVKSNHGHVTAHAASAAVGGEVMEPERSTENVDEYGRRVPIVELGGVNGTCDVSVTKQADADAKSASSNDEPSVLAARVHVDSLMPDTVSVVTSDIGDVDLTVDRKVEADLRLVSGPGGLVSAGGLDVDVLLGEDGEELQGELCRLDGEIDAAAAAKSTLGEQPGRRVDKRICVHTDAFTPSEGPMRSTAALLRHIEYVEGHVENRSHEPDSRFDLKTKPSFPLPSDVNRGIGKVNVEGAAAQALQGFSGGGGQRGDDTTPSLHRPLMAVATSGRIGVETVSWFGAIARRYGMEERRSDLGRQATRSPRVKG